MMTLALAKWQRRDGAVRFDRRAVALGLLSLALVGCSRWRPNTPVEVSLGQTVDAYPRVLASLRTMAYAIVDQDASAGYLRVTAKTISKVGTSAGSIPGPPSWIIVQVSPGRVTLRASGYLVRDDDTVRRSSLDEEMLRLAKTLSAELAR